MSYADVALMRDYNPRFIPGTVAGSLNEYDLPDLMAALAGRKLLLIDPLRADGKIADKSKYEEVLAFPVQVFALDRTKERLRIVNRNAGTDMSVTWKWWLE